MKIPFMLLSILFILLLVINVLAVSILNKEQLQVSSIKESSIKTISQVKTMENMTRHNDYDSATMTVSVNLIGFGKK